MSGRPVWSTEETTEFQIVVTGIKILLLVLFIAGAFQGLNPEPLLESARENAGEFQNIGMTSALVFITFFGFEAIATEGGEIKNPGRNIPLSIFFSMGLVTILYIAVVCVIVVSVRNPDFLNFLIQNSDLETTDEVRTFLADNGEIAMGQSAQFYLGETGFYLFLAGVLFSMISAANATVLAGSRVKMAMARRNHLPKIFSRIHSRYRTPHYSIILTGVLIFLFLLLFTVIFDRTPENPIPLPFQLHLGLESLAHFSDFFLLIGLTFVNLSLIESRRTEPDLDRPFRVPFVPVIPLLGALSSILLLFHVQFQSILFGMLVFIIGALLWPLWRKH